MLDLIVLHGEFSLFTVRGNFWYQIYRNRRKKVLCSRLSLITLTIMLGLYKSLVKPHIEYCLQAWAPMARHGNWSLILELESVQRSFTRMIDGLGLMTYREGLDNLKLTTLLERRVRGDLIEMFKIQEGFVDYGSDLFGRAGKTVSAKSKPHRFTTNETDFFAQRVLRYWNSLPPLV